MAVPWRRRCWYDLALVPSPRFPAARLRNLLPRPRQITPLAAVAVVVCILAAQSSASAGGIALSSSFSGATDDGGGVPPDIQGAAGPDHLLVMLNTKFVAQRKSDGEVLRTWTPADFWSPVSGGDLLF